MLGAKRRVVVVVGGSNFHSPAHDLPVSRRTFFGSIDPFSALTAAYVQLGVAVYRQDAELRRGYAFRRVGPPHALNESF